MSHFWDFLFLCHSIVLVRVFQKLHKYSWGISNFGRNKQFCSKRHHFKKLMVWWYVACFRAIRENAKYLPKSVLVSYKWTAYITFNIATSSILGNSTKRCQMWVRIFLIELFIFSLLRFWWNLVHSAFIVRINVCKNFHFDFLSICGFVGNSNFQQHHKARDFNPKCTHISTLSFSWLTWNWWHWIPWFLHVSYTRVTLKLGTSTGNCHCVSKSHF